MARSAPFGVATAAYTCVTPVVSVCAATLMLPLCGTREVKSPTGNWPALRASGSWAGGGFGLGLVGSPTYQIGLVDVGLKVWNTPLLRSPAELPRAANSSPPTMTISDQVALLCGKL